MFPVLLDGVVVKIHNKDALPETNMEPKKGPIKTTVLLKGDYLGFHVSLGECKNNNSTNHKTTNHNTAMSIPSLQALKHYSPNPKPRSLNSKL